MISSEPVIYIPVYCLKICDPCSEDSIVLNLLADGVIPWISQKAFIIRECSLCQIVVVAKIGYDILSGTTVLNCIGRWKGHLLESLKSLPLHLKLLFIICSIVLVVPLSIFHLCLGDGHSIITLAKSKNTFLWPVKTSELTFKKCKLSHKYCAVLFAAGISILPVLIHLLGVAGIV